MSKNSSLSIMIFFTMAECEHNLDGPGTIRIADLKTRKLIGTIKVSRTLDAFLYLQENVLLGFPECSEGLPLSSQCFGFQWTNGEGWLGDAVERNLCLIELKHALVQYDMRIVGRAPSSK